LRTKVPESTSTVLPTRPVRGDLPECKARAALEAASSNRASPLSRDRAANSSRSVPAQAAQVERSFSLRGEEGGCCPFSVRWTQERGMPVGVSKAGKSLSARSRALFRRETPS
jgi:hypothetical protein